MVLRPVGRDRLLVRLDGEAAGRSIVGGKGASLGRLVALGAPVPRASALTTRAYLDFAASAGLPAHAIGLTSSALASLRERIHTAPLPAAVAAAIRAAWDDLASETDTALAVRSSAPAEDGASHAFAGLHDTALDVRTPDDLDAAVRRCWASLWSERAVAYRRDAGLAADSAGIAVVIQRLVPVDIAFIAFTADPVSGDRDRVVITASWGLGESIVSGRVTPDHIVVGPDTEILAYTIGRKDVMVVPGGEPGTGARTVPVPRLLQETPVLSHGQAARIAGMARALADRLGYPADLEGGLTGGDVHLFQARPITTLATTPPAAPAPARPASGRANRDPHPSTLLPLTSRS